jgi:formyltetrahydrofolate synthetase
MTALMKRTVNPNLMQTIEGQPVLVHTGPSPTSPSASRPFWRTWSA